MQPAEFFPKVTPPSLKAADAAREFQLTLTKPTGSLARLEDLGVWLASCQDQVPPKKLTQPRMVIFAGDHGVATKKVSPYPKEVSIQMAANIKAGGGGINAIANESGIGIRVVDISLDHDEDVDVVGLQERVRRSCGSIDIEDAMTEAELVAAINVGKRIADEEVDNGADLLMAGDLGIGNTSPSAVIIGLLTGQEPVVVTGRGSGVNDEGWKRKVAVVRDAMFRARKDKGDVLTLMRKVTSPELAAMAAFLAQAAVRRTPSISSALEADFTRYPRAPDFMARSTSSRSPLADITSTWMSGNSCTNNSVQVAPSGAGICRSITTTSGRVARARCRHSVPFLATATISKPSSERSSLKASIHMGWSSTNITRFRLMSFTPLPPSPGNAVPIRCLLPEWT